jgi:hypothetical protein
VRGLVTTAQGAPWAGPVDEGHTSAPGTRPEPVHTLPPRVGSPALVCSGARGMGPAQGQRVRTTAGCRASTARPTPPGRRRLQRPGRRAAWLTTPGDAVGHGSVRRRLRRRAALRPHAARRRAAQWATRQRLLRARHTCVATATRAKPATGLQPLQAWGKRHQLEALVPRSRHDGRLRATRATAAPAAATGRDGGSVVETAVPPTARAAQAGPDRERDRQAVAPDVRTMQTGLWEVRPLGVRTAPRPRAQVVVPMWAWQGVRARRRALGAAGGTTEEEQRAVPVAAAVLACARLCLLPSHGQGTAVTRWPTPEAPHKARRDALGTP